MAIDFASGYILKNQTLIANYPFTLACWIYPDVVNIEQAPLALIDKDSVNSYFCDLHIYPNGTCGLRAFNGSVYEETTPAGAISASTWTHLCGVYTSATSRSAYKNGGTKTTTTTSVTLGNLDRVLTGAMQFQGQSILQPYNGKTAEVAVWDVALSDAEVTILALGVSPRLVRPASLKFYFPLVRDIVDYRDSTSPTTLNTSVFDHPRVIYSRGGFSPGVPSSSTSYTLTADSAAYTISSTAASLERLLKLVAASASYALTGTAASLEMGRKLGAEAGSYAVTPTDANLEWARRLVGESVAVALTPTAANLEYHRTLIADSVGSTITATAATLKRSLRLVADSASYVVTVTDVGLKRALRLSAESVSYSIAPTDATLRAGSNPVLSADSVAYALTLTAANLKRSLRLVADSVSCAVTPTDAQLKMSRRLIAESGGCSLTTSAAVLRVARTLSAEPVTLAMSPQDAALRLARRLHASSCAYVVTYSTAGLVYSNARVFYRIVVGSEQLAVSSVSNEAVRVSTVTSESVY